MLRGQDRKEPLWFGRGAGNCLAVWPNKNGWYHEIYIGSGKTGEAGPRMKIMDDELDELVLFLQRIRNGTSPENG